MVNSLKLILTLTVLIGLLGAEPAQNGPRFPIDSLLPKLGGDWVRRNDAGLRGDYSWVNFDGKATGEVLSFVAWKVKPSTKVSASFVGQASIETFLCNGSARFSSSQRGRPIDDIVRHRSILVDIKNSEVAHEVEILEYTYVYDRTEDSPSRIAHGYCVVLDDVVLFVQHTSPRAISSQIAFDAISGVLGKHLFDGKPHSIGKGKTLKTNG